MDKQEYLNQISQNVAPTKKSLPNFFSSKIFKFLLSAVALFVLIMILGAILSGNNNKTKNNAISLKLHLDNLSEAISTYQPSLKSSDLRGYSASLASIVSETSKSLTTFLEEQYEYKEKNVEKSLINSETALYETLNNDLFSAKINGLLDRTYAHEMAYEISIITACESEIYRATKSTDLKEILQSSYDSLENLYDKFNDFSETK